jgi:hypothetical protein
LSIKRQDDLANLPSYPLSARREYKIAILATERFNHSVGHVLPRSCDWIVPLQAFESREIRIHALQNAIVLEREGSEMRVRNKTADSFPISQHRLKNRPVLLARMDHSHAGLIEPALNTLDRFLERKGAAVQAQICANANECCQDRPA